MASGGGISFIELVALGWSSAAAAPAPIPIRVDFDAPPDCSTAEQLYEGIHARSERVQLAAEGEEGWEVRVRLRRVGARVRGELRVIHERGATDIRTVDGTSCDTVVQALSFTAALALDKVAEETEPPPAPRPSPVAPPPPPQPAVVAPAPEPERPPFRLELGAQVVLTQVVSPGMNLGGALVARLTQRTGSALSPSFGLSLIHARNDLIPGADRASVQWTSATLTACPLRWEIARAVSAAPCITASGGWLDATGQGITSPESAARSWWSAGGLARAALSLGVSTALEVEAGLAVPLFRRRFTIGSPAETIAETPVISPLASVGIVHTF
ncbi:hypothetical protein [Sorangium cellulosum]|uniref:Uncharacterized protein n=1 Tax=Sorangium cellulosum TaxID=56 RepID=A0A150QRY0_SORCE|nr:hypothetical protein [Sorangium cellulosum]KYF70714.1 hypothetical protein BE15_34380 [Sorangium cellulosum]